MILVVAGMIAGLAVASRRGDRWDVPAATFAGGLFGLMAAAFWFAVVRSFERAFGFLAGSIWTIALGSAMLGAALALVSLFVFPHRRNEPEVAR
jgi:hypothetical protein